MANDSGQNKGEPSTTFGPAKKYAREGASHHRSGWQEESPLVEKGAHTAPRAPKGSIPRTTVADRLRQRLAEQGKG
jgi:hypothetical protein